MGEAAEQEGRDWRTKWQKWRGEKEEDLGRRQGARRDVIAGEARRLSPREPLSAATCCDGSPFALMRGHLQEAWRRITTAASTSPNLAVKKALPLLTLVCRVAQRGHTCVHVHCAGTARVTQTCYAMYRVLKGGRSGGGA